MYKGKGRDSNDDRDKVVNSAHINHESSDSQSDGAGGNDNYYDSDMTAESEGDTYISAEEKTKQTWSLKTTAKAALVSVKISEKCNVKKSTSSKATASIALQKKTPRLQRIQTKTWKIS
ncbi:hypothetical protein METBIDRAFT_10966 [Metschnikowia bicuspidata var. bicuspidata NRRL YB-4993]|uniref:Uncharacterized protein n=1 Tax=Metschnikowia bicuspidata var. bicuspidata NRRL YB-4993 TaxID=869754 RepID=A0A1A0HDH7_9ASCO|nr:hypothetical protein METBIDRAFT_10966 [Metschnikowia bicuspidata var. bicuspidata NRRL YB-4993]OBA22071.1 hypothetical protein METBIDRAFT_10966 [Metschnikowia bicuspidata var. bicuspidata NRRL YB-4993]